MTTLDFFLYSAWFFLKPMLKPMKRANLYTYVKTVSSENFIIPFVGTGVGASVGRMVGIFVGAGVGISVGVNVGSGLGTGDGAHVGTKVGLGVGADVGNAVGSKRHILGDVSETLSTR